MATAISKTHRNKLKRCRASLVGEMRVEDVLPHFICQGVLDHTEAGHVQQSGDSRGKATKLLSILGTKGERGYFALLSALRQYHRHLYEQCEQYTGDWMLPRHCSCYKASNITIL